MMSEQQDAIERLESWHGGHKSRSVEIGIDNGYGATCWEVKLSGNAKEVIAAETNFFRSDCPPPEHVVYVVDGGASGFDWPGLAATIHAAIDRAEKIGL